MYTMNDFIEQKIAVSFANREEWIKFFEDVPEGRAYVAWRMVAY